MLASRTLSLLPFAVLVVGCKPDLKTTFERVSAESCECSIDKPTRALRIDKIVKDIDIGYSDLSADFSLAVSGVLREDLENLPLREFADFMVEAMNEEPATEADTIVGCEDVQVDGRPAILCDMQGELTHFGLVKTPARLLAVVITVKRNADGDRAAKRIFYSLRSTERQLTAADDVDDDVDVDIEVDDDTDDSATAPASAP